MAPLTRRDFMMGVLPLLGCTPRARGRTGRLAGPNRVLNVCLCHLDVQVGALERNCAALEAAMRLAAKHGAQWFVTPELALSGYHFDRHIGTDWIAPGPDRYARRLGERAQALGLALVLGHAERVSGRLYNTLFAIDANGRLRGRHHKINTIPVSEDWSSRGRSPNVFELDRTRVGPLICADAWPTNHARTLKQQRAEMLVSCANWARGEHGPGDTWERRSAETDLPLFVCNRTGTDDGLDFRSAQSVLSHRGRRLFSLDAATTTLAMLAWDRSARRLVQAERWALR